MPGEEEASLGSGSAAQLLTSAGTLSGKETPRTNHEAGGSTLLSACSGSSGAFGLPTTKPPHPPQPPPPTTLSSSHHAEIEEAETPSSSGSGGSKLELELQFAGVDHETVELEEVECNYGSAVFGSTPVDGGGGGALGGAEEGVEDQEVKPPDPPPIIPQTALEKCLFYTTAFFILLAVFSLFLFLFLVPFVIDPAFTTIFNEFDPEPALCRTEGIVNLWGTQCTKTWTSCREGCTKDIYNCTQIYVSYKAATPTPPPHQSDSLPPPPPAQISLKQKHHSSPNNNPTTYYNYNHGSNGGGNEPSYGHRKKKHKGGGESLRGLSSTTSPLLPNDGWVRKAHLFPNVKGCGYPPSLNCSIFLSKYAQEGKNFSCYYSKVKPWLVVTSFNMNLVVLELALSMAIPIPCFIVSVIYLVFAYFKIYNTSSTASSSRQVPVDSTTNNNGPSPSPEPPQTSLSTLDEKARAFVRKSSSRTLNALTEKLLPNSKPHPPMEMNDLTPIISRNPAEDNQIRNNRAPERNGPTNPPVKNKG